MSPIAKAREFFRPGGLACPRCEKPLEGHDDKACERRMSRRYFFGALAGGVAAAVALPKVVDFGLEHGTISALPSPEVTLESIQQIMDDFARFYIEPAVKSLISEIDRTILEYSCAHGIGYFVDSDGIKMWPQPENVADAGGLVTITQHIPRDRVLEFNPQRPYPCESSVWTEDNLKPGAVFTMDVTYLENPPSRGRRCPAYNERTGKWDNPKDPRRLPA